MSFHPSFQSFHPFSTTPPTIARGPRIARHGRQASLADRRRHAWDGRVRRPPGWRWADGSVAARHCRVSDPSACRRKLRAKPRRNHPAQIGASRTRPVRENRGGQPGRSVIRRPTHRAWRSASRAFRRRPRPLEQRILQHAPRRRIDLDRHDVDGRRGRMRFEVEHEKRAQHLGIAHGGRQLQHPRMPRAIDEPQIQMDGRGAPVRALERRATTARAVARARTPAARARRSAIRARCARGNGAHRDRARADSHQLHAPCAGAQGRPARAAQRAPRPAAPRNPPASSAPIAAVCRTPCPIAAVLHGTRIADFSPETRISRIDLLHGTRISRIS